MFGAFVYCENSFQYKKEKPLNLHSENKRLKKKKKTQLEKVRFFQMNELKLTQIEKFSFLTQGELLSIFHFKSVHA